MKKSIILITFFWFLSVFSHAEDRFKKVFGKYVDKNYVCYDFIVHNPTLVSGMYYCPQTKKMRNKILLKKDSSYWINKAGYKLWSDSDVSDISYIYYNFDSQGHIDRTDIIWLKDDKDFYNKRTTFYTLTDNQYIISYFSENSKKEKKEVYDIVISDGSLLLKYQDYNYLYQYEYKPGMIVYSVFKDDALHHQSIYEYKENSLISSLIWYDGNKEGVLEQKVEYKNGRSIKDIRPLPDGEGVYIFDDKTMLRKYTETRKGNTREGSVYKEEIEYSSLGYICSVRENPVGTEKGNYKIIDYYLLPQKDDVLEKYFADWPKK